jgi:hypothetical protein
MCYSRTLLKFLKAQYLKNATEWIHIYEEVVNKVRFPSLSTEAHEKKATVGVVWCVQEGALAEDDTGKGYAPSSRTGMALKGTRRYTGHR